MGEEMNWLAGKGILINKKTGEMKDLGEVTIKEACHGELDPGDERIELKTPSFFGGEQKTITFTVKVRSKRKLRKLAYSLSRQFRRKRAYLSKRECVDIIEKAFYQNGLPMPLSYYMRLTHRQLMNIIINTAYLIRKFRNMPKVPELTMEELS